MRKLATLSMAVVASFALAGAASATMVASIVGSNLPGTNTYSIVMSFATADSGGIVGISSSVTTTGIYTGVFTDAINPPGFFTGNSAGPLTPPLLGNTGFTGIWAWVSGSTQPGGSYTIGTVTITVGAGNVISPFMSTLDGFVTGASFSTVAPDVITGITIIPEPTTGALLGLGIAGLVMAGRRSRRA